MRKQFVQLFLILKGKNNNMSSKERYLSKEEYKKYERFKSDIKAGRLLNPESLLCLAESVDNNPTRLGLILLKKIEQYKAEDPYLQDFSDTRFINDPSTTENEDESFLPFIEYTR